MPVFGFEPKLFRVSDGCIKTRLCYTGKADATGFAPVSPVRQTGIRNYWTTRPLLHTLHFIIGSKAYLLNCLSRLQTLHQRLHCLLIRLITKSVYLCISVCMLTNSHFYITFDYWSPLSELHRPPMGYSQLAPACLSGVIK